MFDEGRNASKFSSVLSECIASIFFNDGGFLMMESPISGDS